MKNFIKDLAEQGISSEQIDAVAQTLQTRAQQRGFAHPLSVYQSLAIDLALGAVETQKEAAANLDSTHSSEDWLNLIVGL